MPEMQTKIAIKACPNCGSMNVDGCIDDTIDCDDCGESRDWEDWQTDSAREKLLRINNARLDKMLNWMIQQIPEISDSRQCPPNCSCEDDYVPHLGQCLDCWREAAAKAVQA